MAKSPLTALRDPREAYPKPPFPEQPQPEPGLAAEMDPRPDHGEASYVGSGRLEGRRALITGGDSGIGRAVAIAYAREGAAVCINYLEAESRDAESLRALIEDEGGTIHLLPGDLTDQAFAESLVATAADRMGGLDVMVINAGKQVFQETLQDVSADQFDQTMKTNVYAMFWMTRAALRLMPPGSSIINVTSVQGYDPSPTLIDYATTKFAIRGFTEAMGQAALTEHGVRVNGVAPGPFWTPLQPSRGQPQEKVAQFGGKVPMGRPGQPAEIGPLFVYLASGESSYVSGAVYAITGGMPTS
jgi:NAD(P)-dependent dehydrogenase (short-subunit alcohol dehydrogenase family)